MSLALRRQLTPQVTPQDDDQAHEAALAAWRGRVSDLLTYWAQGSDHYLVKLGMDRKLSQERYQELKIRADETRLGWLEAVGCDPKNSLAAVPYVMGNRLAMANLIGKGWLPPKPVQMIRPRSNVSEEQRRENAEKAAAGWVAA